MLGLMYDLFFPKRCVGCKKVGTYICSNCLAQIEFFQQYVCPMCLLPSSSGKTHPSCIIPLGLEGISSAVVYRRVVKKLLSRLTYAPYLSDLGLVMNKLAIEALSQNEPFMGVLSSHPIVAEVPLFSQKLKTRGYSQAEILARALAHEFKMKYSPNIMIRTKSINSYSKLNKSQRFTTIHDAFEINPKNTKLINNKTVVLVDDLASSCATLRECAKLLKQNGAKKVYGVTFACEL